MAENVKVNNAYKIDPTEVEIANLKDNAPNDTSLSDTNILITNKRIYVNTKTKTHETENIIDINTVEYVNYVHEQKQRISVVALILCFALLITGIFVAVFAMLVLGLCIAGVGLLGAIICAAVGRKRHYCKLILGASSGPVEIDVGEIKPDSIKKIQRLIFEELDKNRLKK